MSELAKTIIVAHDSEQVLNALLHLRKLHKGQGWVQARVMDAPRGLSFILKAHFDSNNRVWLQKCFAVTHAPTYDATASAFVGTKHPTHAEGRMELKPTEYDDTICEAVEDVYAQLRGGAA